MSFQPKSAFSNALTLYPSMPITGEQDGWKTVPIRGSDEKLVPLGAFAGDPHAEYKPYSQIFTDSMYFAQHNTSPYKEGQLNGALLTVFVRKAVGDALVEAQKLLPEGYAFVVWDAFRPQEVQGALFEDYRNELISKDGQSLEEATVNAQQFVSIPSDDPSCPPPHNTGASVDLGVVKFNPQDWKRLEELNALIEKEPNPDKYYAAEMERMQLYRNVEALDMGTRFDEMSEKVESRYYEDRLAEGSLLSEENQILLNRRMLVDVMRCVGMSNYGPEWFHFDLNNQFDAKRMGKDSALYGAAAMSDKNWQHEHMRREHSIGSELLRQQTVDPFGRPVLVSDHPLAPMVQVTARKTGALDKSETLLRGDCLEFHPAA